jgi:diguanylate cyclase (GGDEF)-like protein/PAS domain S-box-containing protein
VANRLIAGDGPPEHGETAIAVAARIPTILVVALLLVATPGLGPERYREALLIFGVTSLNSLVHLKLLQRTGRVPLSMAVIDAAVAWYAAYSLTGATAVVCLVALFGVCLCAYEYSTTDGRIAAGLLVAGVAGGSLQAGSSTWYLWGIGFGIAAAAALLGVQSLAQASQNMRARFASLVEGLDAIIWEIDPDTFTYTYVSPQLEAFLGYRPERWVGQPVWSKADPEDRERLTGVLEGHLERGHLGVDLEYRARAADGRWVHLQDRVSVDWQGTGGPKVIRGVTVDVSDRHETEGQMRQFADLVDHIGTALMILEVDGDQLLLDAANPAAELAIGRPVRDMVGRPLVEVVPHLQASPLIQSLLDVAHTGEPHNRDGILLQDPTLPQRVFAVHAFVLDDQTVAMSLTDVTSSSMAAATLRRQALHDELTGLPNRSNFRLALEKAIEEKEEVAMLLLDLNQFKEVNDALGHHHGDLLLIEVARRMREEVPIKDLVARLGGDEFAVLLSEDSSLDRAQAIATQIRDALEQPFEIGTLSLQTNASIGIAGYPEHAEDAETLTKRADVAMYLAKRTGLGSTLYQPEQDHSSVRKLTLIGELRRGLDLEEFTLHYQPVIALDSGLCRQAEALVRWHHPEQGLLLPDEFIRLAEVSGMVQPLTRFVLDKAISAASSWHAKGYDLGVAVNLSVRNLYEPDLTAHLAALIDKHGYPANRLTLEITESELMDDPHQAAVVLHQLHQIGVGTSIDDFGKGYSSLTYLKDLPLKQLKIDQSFVAGMRRRSRDLAIVKSMVELGHSLGLVVVAEGVTGDETLDMLAELGCDLAQGFLISKPVTSEALVAWVSRHQGTSEQLAATAAEPLADTGSTLPPR